MLLTVCPEYEEDYWFCVYAATINFELFGQL
jgi:hypothetical protein